MTVTLISKLYFLSNTLLFMCISTLFYVEHHHTDASMLLTVQATFSIQNRNMQLGKLV